MRVMKEIINDRVLEITVVVMAISLFFARPKLQDINFSTLCTILAMLTVIQIFEHLHILDFGAYRLTNRADTARQLTRFFWS